MNPAPAASVSAAEAPAAAPSSSEGRRIGMANPASKNCADKGGKLEIRDEPAGQSGVCIFADGSRCEEWAFFRGQCAPGQCKKPDGKCQ